MLPEDGTGIRMRDRESGERERKAFSRVCYFKSYSMLPEDGTGTQERDRVEKERAKLLVVLVTFRFTVCCRKMERVRRGERVEKERAKLSAVLVTFLCHADGRWNWSMKRRKGAWG
jgi:hypothetical protein